MTTKDPRLAKRIEAIAENRYPSSDDVFDYENRTDRKRIIEGSNLLAPLLEQFKEAVERIDKWTIDPKDKAIDENFAGEGCRQFIKDRCNEALAAYERFLEGVKL